MKQTRTTLVIDGLEVEVTFKKMKNVRLRVLPPEGRVAVSAPHRTPRRYIEQFVRDQAQWIHARAAEARGRSAPGAADIREGRIRVWGRWVPIEAQSTPAQLDAVLRSHLEPEVYRLLATYESRLAVRASRIRFRRMKTRWGSCNPSTGSITVNIALAEHPPECVEYVVVHELAHLKERGHGAAFRAIMDRHLPDWQSRRAALSRVADPDDDAGPLS